MIDAAVVVVTYNSAGDIGSCLGSLPIDELAAVVVVDNASTDGTAELLRREWPNVTLLALEENVGFGAGCNRGAASVDARFVLFLNPDATIDAGNLEALVAYARDHPQAGMVAPALVGMSSSGDLPTLRTELRYAVPPRLACFFPERRHPPGRPTGPVDVVEGACMLVDRELFERVGRFDERFFLFFEEADLARRIRAEGREVHLVAEANAHHGIGASRAGTALGSRPHYLRSTVRYLRRWEGGAAATAFAVLASLTFRLRSRFGSLPEDEAALLREGLRDRRSLFVAWSRQPRSAAVAELIGADVHMITVGRHGQRALVPLRYAVQALATAWQLARRRPGVVVVMCPPLALGLLVLAYAKATGATMAVDAHTAAILRRGRIRRSIRFFDRHGAVLIVAGDHIADHLEANGLRRPSAIHDPMPALSPTKAATTGNVVVPLGWAPDEPIGDVLEAARRLPEHTFILTGRPKGEWAEAPLPPNVERAGLLPKADYDRLVQGAGVVVALTTRPFTMLRAGYEAVQARVLVVVSDTPTLRDYFGDAAVFVAPSLAEAITDALARRDELTKALDSLASDHAERQQGAVAELRGRVGVRSPSS
jgi:N-acetylglucosaminyl-diphospho-decaprenol L-rhamnosyltransferase